MRQGIFLPESTSSADRLSYGVRKVLCAIACINICADVKNPKHWQPPLSGQTEMLHTPDSDALAAAVSYQVRPPELPTRCKEEIASLFLKCRPAGQ